MICEGCGFEVDSSCLKKFGKEDLLYCSTCRDSRRGEVEEKDNHTIAKSSYVCRPRKAMYMIHIWKGRGTCPDSWMVRRKKGGGNNLYLYLGVFDTLKKAVEARNVYLRKIGDINIPPDPDFV